MYLTWSQKEDLLNNGCMRQFLSSAYEGLQLSGTDIVQSNVDYDISLHVLICNIRDTPAIIVEAMPELELMRERFGRALGY